MMEHIFIDLSFLIMIAVIIAVFMKKLKQPPIIGYIITGVLVGPYVLNLVKNESMIQTFSQIGIAFLLFTVGLSLNPKVIKKIGKTALLTGTAQIIISFVLSFILSVYLGFSYVTSGFIAIALSFSSTIIILKLLSDKGRLESLHGRLAIGLLIVQDIVAILALITLSSISPASTGTEISFTLIGNISKGIILICAVSLFSFLFFPKITKYIAKTQEFLFLFSVGWCFVVSSIFYYFFRFSVDKGEGALLLGALLAGVTLSIVPYSSEIHSRVKPLRDFFMVLFFVLLGSQIVGLSRELLIKALYISLFVFIVKPLIVLIILGILGYTRRNSFLTASSMGQISEFSIIILLLGFALGYLSAEIVSMVTFIFIITTAGSTYMISYSDKIYYHISKSLRLFERKKITNKKFEIKPVAYNAILFGYNRIGFNLLNSLKKIKENFIVVDFNPDTIDKLTEEKINCRYGDAGDIEMLNSVVYDKTKLIISTVPEQETNLLLTKKARYISKKSIIVVIADQIDDALKLYEAGATYVLMPHFLGGDYASKIIEKYKTNIKEFRKLRIEHIKHIKERLKHGHEHPRSDRNR